MISPKLGCGCECKGEKRTKIPTPHPSTLTLKIGRIRVPHCSSKETAPTRYFWKNRVGINDTGVQFSLLPSYWNSSLSCQKLMHISASFSIYNVRSFVVFRILIQQGLSYQVFKKKEMFLRCSSFCSVLPLRREKRASLFFLYLFCRFHGYLLSPVLTPDDNFVLSISST